MFKTFLILLIAASAASAASVDADDHADLHAHVLKAYEDQANKGLLQCNGEDEPYWRDQQMQSIADSLARTVPNTNRAKNVIFFIGDGMSMATVSAAAIHRAKQYGAEEGRTVEGSRLAMQKLDHAGMSKTYSIDFQITDSASSATGMFSGVKAREETLGFDCHVNTITATSMEGQERLENILDWVQEAGMSTGLVTTQRVTHATPAALYAATYDRNFESDSTYRIPFATPPDYAHDIAWQLVKEPQGKGLNVILGGGYRAFYPVEQMEEINNRTGYDTDDERFRRDGEELAAQWLQEHDRARIVFDRTELDAVDPAVTDNLMGLFGPSSLPFEDPGTTTLEQGRREPTIGDMVDKAVDVLSKGDNGFFLLVEGGKIDSAHHSTEATRALQETVAMDFALESAMAKLEAAGQLEDTLIIVTADHGHTMSFQGYSVRGTDVRGLAHIPALDLKPFEILTYANGESFEDTYEVSDRDTVVRTNLHEYSQDELVASDFKHASAMFMSSETHSGDEVAIFASGPYSHLIHSSHEAPYIAYVMAYAACVGPYKDECADRGSTTLAVTGDLPTSTTASTEEGSGGGGTVPGGAAPSAAAAKTFVTFFAAAFARIFAHRVL